MATAGPPVKLPVDLFNECREKSDHCEGFRTVAFRFKGIKVSLVPHDGSPNPRNPFDRLSPEERAVRMRRVLARVALRTVADGSVKVATEPDLSGGANAETPSNGLATPTTYVDCTDKPSGR